jgi:hypothetical protein
MMIDEGFFYRQSWFLQAEVFQTPLRAMLLLHSTAGTLDSGLTKI